MNEENHMEIKAGDGKGKREGSEAARESGVDRRRRRWWRRRRRGNARRSFSRRSLSTGFPLAL